MAITPPPSSHEPQPDPAVVLALQAMGLDSDHLRAAILAGYVDKARVTSHDVVTRGGFLMWATPLRYLGDAYVRKGFRRERPGGFEVLRSPDETFDISVAPGTYATGQSDRMPSTSIERGPLTGQAVDGNRGQMLLESNVIPFGAKEVRPDAIRGRWTWLLLHFYDESADEIRVELSVPVEFDRKRPGNGRGIVTHFDPRLILPPIVLDASTDIEDEDEGDDEIDIPIDRRP